MSGLLPLAASFMAGALLGWVFFWGLWLTVDGLDSARCPPLRVLASMLLRFGLVLGGFYAIARCAEWQHLFAAAIGFSVLRLFVVRIASLRRLHGESIT